jgi:hypothetical protein
MTQQQQWQFTGRELQRLYDVLLALVEEKNTIPLELSPDFQRALQVYKPGMSCRVLAQSLGVTVPYSRSLMAQLKAYELRSGSDGETGDLDSQLLSKLGQILSPNATFVLQRALPQRLNSE